jgi:hypothetical protein
MVGEEIKEIPLRHKRNEAAMRWEMGEIRDFNKSISDLRAERWYFLMGSLQKFLQEAELMHDLQRRGVNGVPAKIAQEICVLLENQNGNSGSGQEES